MLRPEDVPIWRPRPAVVGGHHPTPLVAMRPERELDRAVIRRYLALIESIAKSNSNFSAEAWSLLEELLMPEVNVEARLRQIECHAHTIFERMLRQRMERS